MHHRVASFPGRSHRQDFIASTTAGKAWEIWSHAMPSGKHTEGGAQRRSSMSCVVLSVQWLDIRVFARLTIHTVRCSQCRGRTNALNGWAPPPMCLPSLYLTSSHVTRSHRPSPAVFILQAMEYWWWERPGNEATTGCGVQS